MNTTQGIEALLSVLLASAASPAISARCDVVLDTGEAEKIFIAEPRGSRVLIRFGLQSLGHPNLMLFVQDAVVAAEALAYGLTTARAIRLDAGERAWFEWAAAQREQGSD